MYLYFSFQRLILLCLFPSEVNLTHSQIHLNLRFELDYVRQPGKPLQQEHNSSNKLMVEKVYDLTREGTEGN